jgi:class 3 adenylate cyclase/tetratricopeptide (TPR) repeat protein
MSFARRHVAEAPVRGGTDVDQVTCPACGSESPQGFRFCGSCGASLERTCPRCGATNPAGFRFCGACGSALDAGEVAATVPAAVRSSAPPAVLATEERKVVTALFADLTASTELATRLDPEDLRSVLKPFFDAMAAEIERYGGTVEKFIGDAVVAFFGVPVAHEDDPVRAIRAALAMQRRLGELNLDLAAQAGGDLAMRIGVNTGEVFAHGGGADEGLVTGESVNVASRFQAIADPGSIVVGERTRRDAGAAFSFGSLGDVRVKGVDRPLRAWVVEAEREAPSGPRVSAPFVGRVHELELLRLLFDRAARERRANLATIVGAPGIGKSRLAHEAVAALEAHAPGLRVLRGRCLPYGDGLTYWPLAEILKAEAGILDSDPPEEILRKARASLEPRFAGEDGIGVTAVLLSSIGVTVPSDPLAGADTAAAERMIVRAWQRAIERIADGRPLVALIEDIHWADPRLLDLLEAVTARVDGPVLMICIARPDLFERRPGWGGAVADATRISLSPLSAGEGTALIEHLLGGQAPAELVGPILHRSDGNPFFAAELLRMMTEDGTIARGDRGWTLVRELPSTLPDTVQAVIASRLDLLDPREKRVLQEASVVGRIFWQGGVERLTGGAVGPVLDALADKGLVLDRGRSSIEGERELIFNHVLTRDVAYASIPRARLAGAHATVAAWMDEGVRGREEEFAEILAFHYAHAGDRSREARAAMLAGRRHRRVFAADQAIAWYERGLDALGDDLVDASDAAVRAELRLSRGEALEQLGRFEEALEDYDAALAGARGELEVTAAPGFAGDAGELEARALAAKAHVLWLLDRYEEGGAILPEALDLARRAGPPELEARLLYTAGTMAFGRGSFEEALGFQDDALAAATAVGDEEGRALALHGLCETRFLVGPVREGLRNGREADAILRTLGQRPMVHHNGYMIGWLEWFVGEEKAISTVTAAVDGCREVGNIRDEIMALACRIEMRLARAEPGAGDDARRAVDAASEIEAPRALMIALINAADVAAEPWAFDALRERAAEATAIHARLSSGFFAANIAALSGWIALLEGDAVAAADAFERAQAPGLAPLDRLWAARTEFLAWESAGDAARMLAVGARPMPSLDEIVWSPWLAVATAVGRAARSEWSEALDAAAEALEDAARAPERRVERRAARVAWLALRELDRPDEAERMRLRAVGAARAVADSMESELRTGFLARPDVADVLGI